MNAVKALRAHAAAPPPLVNPGTSQLRGRDDTVLVRGKTGNEGVWSPVVTFFTHVGALSDNAPDLAPSAPISASP
jgi:hypothetical protein